MLIAVFSPESPLMGVDTAFTKVWCREKMREIIHFLLGCSSPPWTRFPNTRSAGQLCSHSCAVTVYPQVCAARLIIILYFLGCQWYKECTCSHTEQVNTRLSTPWWQPTSRQKWAPSIPHWARGPIWEAGSPGQSRGRHARTSQPCSAQAS